MTKDKTPSKPIFHVNLKNDEKSNNFSNRTNSKTIPFHFRSIYENF